MLTVQNNDEVFIFGLMSPVDIAWLFKGHESKSKLISVIFISANNSVPWALDLKEGSTLKSRTEFCKRMNTFVVEELHLELS